MGLFPKHINSRMVTNFVKWISRTQIFFCSVANLPPIALGVAGCTVQMFLILNVLRSFYAVNADGHSINEISDH